MKKSFKGFTLIELLAVIVILAIIALIATPIILNVIERSRKSAAVDSAYGYIEAIEKQNALAAMSPDKYTVIPDGTDLNISSIQVSVKGEKPTSGKITIGKGRVTSANVCVSGYTVAYDGKEAEVSGKCIIGKVSVIFKNGDTTVDTKQVDEGSTIGSFPNITLGEGEKLVGWYKETSFTNKVETTTTVSENMTLYAKIDSPKTCNDFSSDDWSVIVDNTYPVGCTKELSVGNTSYTVRIANISTPQVCSITGYSQTSCGFVIEFVDLLQGRAMSSGSSTGGWNATSMRTYLNGEFYNSLPSDLKAVIIPTNPVVSGSSKNSTSPDTNDKIYLLSTREVGFDLTTDNKNNIETDTRILDYYDSHNNDSARIKSLNDTASYCWLRSANSNDSNNYYFQAVSPSGVNYNAGNGYYTYAVAPAFRIGN